jgi:hypothetical protein
MMSVGGYAGHTIVELQDGTKYPAYFIDPVGLRRNIEDGAPVLANPGLIFLPEVTVEAIQLGVEFAWREGFFERLVPLPSSQEETTNVATGARQSKSRPRVIFDESFTERDLFEMTYRGYVEAVQVEADHKRYRGVFYEPVRLTQTLQDLSGMGTPCFAEPGLIVVPEVTVEMMYQAIEILQRRGHFNHLAPI